MELRSLISANINARYLADEASTVRELLAIARTSAGLSDQIRSTASALVTAVRANADAHGGIDALLAEYDLSSQEGVLLMCLAEALLRIPDADTADALIADKLGSGNWTEHLGGSESLFVNASTWGLMLTGRLVELDDHTVADPRLVVGRLAVRIGDTVLRAALKQSMRIMARQFVMGRDIDAALSRAVDRGNRGYRYSFDMLGEEALTAADAERYFDAYHAAIKAIGNSVDKPVSALVAPSISVKLSALHPRYEFFQQQRVLAELTPRITALAKAAQHRGLSLTIDAEEAERLELSLAVFAEVYRDPSLQGWSGLGIAVQAYQKRALYVLRWLTALAQTGKRPIPVRLVKGAYWDTEIKRAQEQGLAGYPVFTRKSNTDLAYLACAQVLLDQAPHLYPQFATHNAQTVAHILHVAGKRAYEFQRLHGMGEDLYGYLLDSEEFAVHCRVYAPVGAHETLLPYLVRRLLENGANSSFVQRITDKAAPLQDLVADPIGLTDALGAALAHPNIPLPADMFGAERRNSAGINRVDHNEMAQLLTSLHEASQAPRVTASKVDGESSPGIEHEVRDPADRTKLVGKLKSADKATVETAIATAYEAWTDWNATPVEERAQCLERAAGLYERSREELLTLLVREAGRTVVDGIGEIREAVDFLRYYAVCARKQFKPRQLPGPTGERNELRLQGRGVFICISPWNFPLAIFTGQLAAALVSGNTVVAKPAEQTSLIAGFAVKLMHEARFPASVLNLLVGDGPTVGEAALIDPRVVGVAFTGSTATAARITEKLAERSGPLATLIAETGGQNAMLVDSSALAEQVVRDACESAFNSAGQRCSALRVLYLQEDVASRMIEMLKGRMDQLVIGDPSDLATDVGPLIDARALQLVSDHVAACHPDTILHQCRLTAGLNGNFFAPIAVRIDGIRNLPKEVFGPVLHVASYAAEQLDTVLDDINAVGYGLTLGIHTRIERKAEYISRRARVGNIYVNRNMIGAAVGVQPFGGRGLSGTGPKAGGPNYLRRFATEQTYTVNTAAVGGNATLLSLSDRVV